MTGQVLTAKQDSIATLDVLTSVGTTGIDTVFKGPIDATAEGLKGDLTGQVLTAKQDSIATLDVLTSVGTTGIDTVFKGPIDATAEGLKGDLTGQVLTTKQDSIATLDALTSVGSTGVDTVFKGPVDATAEGFKGDIAGDLTGQVLTAKQDSIATLDALTAVGTSTIKTVFKGPIEGKEGVESDLTGQVLTAKQDSIATLDALTSVGSTGVDTVFKGPVDATAEGFKGDIAGDLTGQVLTAKQDSIATLDSLTSVGTTEVDTVFKGPIDATEGLKGNVTLVDEPTNDKHATTKKYVDDQITTLTGTETLNEALDTLKEIGDYLTDNTVVDGVVQQLAAKQNNLTAGHNISIANVTTTQTFTLNILEGNSESDTAPKLQEGAIADLIAAGVKVGDTIKITKDDTDYDREIQSIDTDNNAIVLTTKLADDFPAENTEITVSVSSDPVLTIKTTGAVDEESAILFDNFSGTVKTKKLYLNETSGNLEYNDAPIKGRLNTIEPTKLMTPYMAILNNNGIDANLKTALTDIISALADTIPESFDIGPALLVMSSDSVVNGGFNNDATIPIKFSWSEILKDDLTLDDLTLVNCTLTDLAKDETNKRIYTATLTPTEEGAVSVTLNDGAKIDHAGNVTNGQLPFTYTYDVTNPTTTLNIYSSNANKAFAKLDNTVTLAINADENIKEPVVGMKLKNIPLDPDHFTITAVNGTTESVNGSVITYSDKWTCSFDVSTAINDDNLKVYGLKTDADALLAQITTNPKDAIDNANLANLATTTSGDGEGAILSLVIAGNTVTSVTVTTTGSGYAVGDTVTVSNTLIDGTDTDLVFTLVADNLVDVDGITAFVDGDMTFSVIATDLAENQADANTTIVEKDSVSTMTILRSKPIITVNDVLVVNNDPQDASSNFIERLGTYTEDKTAVNSAGTDITTEITQVSNNLDTDTADSTPYEIVYTVTDSAGNVSDNTTVKITVVDTTPPLVAKDASDNEILTVLSDNTVDTLAKKDDDITISFTSNEELEASSDAIETTVTFTIGDTEKTAINLTQQSGSTDKLKWKGTYTVQDGDTGLVSYVLKITDIYGNVTTTESADSEVVVDTTAPIVAKDASDNEILTVLSNNELDHEDHNYAIQGDTVTLKFTASEELHGTAANNTVTFELDGNQGSALNLSRTDNQNAFEYKASFNVGGTLNGAVKYKLKLTDLAGNVTQQATFNDTTLIMDVTEPTISANSLSVTSDNNDDSLAKKDDVVTLKFTASEALHGTAANNTVVFKVGDGDAKTAINLAATDADDGHTYEASFTVAASETGVVKYKIKMTDLAGNVTEDDSFNDSDVTVDTTAPTITDDTLTVTSNNDDDSLAKKDDVVTLKFTASEALHGTAANNTVVFKVGDGDAKTAINLGATDADDGHTYEASFTVGAGENGLVKYKIKITDLTGNVTEDSDFVDSDLTVDTTAPTITENTLTVTSNNDDDSLAKKDDVVTLKFTASEALHGTAANNTVVFKVGDGDAKTAINLGATDADDGHTYEASFTVGDNETGVVKYKIKMTDLAGNITEETSFTDSGVTVDTTAPTITENTLTVVSSNELDAENATLAIQDDTVTLKFTASEELHGTAENNTVVFKVGDGNAKTAINLAATTDENDGHTYEASFTVAEGDTGVVKYKIKITDPTGNKTEETSFNDSDVTVDTTAPTISANSLSIVSNNNDNTLAKQGDIVTLKFTASEALHGTAENNTVVFKVGDGDAKTAINLAATAAEDGHTYEASFTVAASENGVIKYKIKMTDLAGNVTEDSDFIDSDVTADTTSPTVTFDGISHNRDVSAETGSGTATAAGVGDTVTIDLSFSEELSGITISDNVVVKIQGDANNMSSDNLTLADGDDDNSYKVSFTVAEGYKSGSVTITLNALTDKAGNALSGTKTKTFNSTTEMLILDASPTLDTSGFTNTATITGDASATTPAANGATAVDSASNALTTSVSIPNDYDGQKAGQYTITWSATDNAGQTSSASATYTISDSDGPTLTVSSISSNNENGNGVSTSGDTITVGISSDQDIKSGSLSITLQSGAQNFANTATFTIDPSNNKLATASISVSDSDLAGVVTVTSLSCTDINDVNSKAFTATNLNDAVILYVAKTSFDTAPDTSVTYDLDNATYNGENDLLSGIGGDVNDSNGTAMTLELVEADGNRDDISSANHGTTFTVKVKATDPAGNTLESGDITITTNDPSAPVLIDTDPVVLVDAFKVTMVFNEAIEINGNTFTDIVINGSSGKTISNVTALGAVVTITTSTYMDPTESLSLQYTNNNSLIRRTSSGLGFASMASAVTIGTPDAFKSITDPTIASFTYDSTVDTATSLPLTIHVQMDSADTDLIFNNTNIDITLNKGLQTELELTALAGAEFFQKDAGGNDLQINNGDPITSPYTIVFKVTLGADNELVQEGVDSISDVTFDHTRTDDANNLSKENGVRMGIVSVSLSGAPTADP